MNAPQLEPGKLLRVSGQYWETCTLHAGVKLDVFSAIGSERRTAGDVAAQIDADPRATEMLLNALTAMALLAKSGSTYANSEISATFLTKDSPRYIGYMIMHHYHLVESWSRLDEAVKTGRSIRSRTPFSDEDKRESFLMGMFNLAMGIAPKVSRQIKLAGRRHLLDLGGGPGTYAIHFCLENPALTATVYDLPTTRPFAEKTIAGFGLSGRIRFMPGDYVDGEISGAYDVAWLSHVLHGESPGACRQMIEKTVRVLNPGGLLFVHDFILTNDMDGPLFPALFSLNMLLGTDAGQAYSEKQIMDMLSDAGLTDIRRIPVDTPNDSGIITGVLQKP